MKKVYVLMLALMVSASSFAAGNPEKTETTVPASVSLVKPGTVQLAIAANDGMANVQLKDQDGNVIYNVSLKLKKEHVQAFDISQLDPGSYTFEISVGSQTITKSFSIEYVPSKTNVIIG